ncbi:MAG: hypothetical protein R6X25_12210 [Candidatus Krumholzibacteriia bacterium]
MHRLRPARRHPNVTTAGLVIAALAVLAGAAGAAPEPGPAAGEIDDGDATGPAVAAESPPGLEVLFATGLAVPRGHLDDAWGTRLGTNARAGYDLGMALRVFLGDRAAFTPAFHFTQFRAYEARVDADDYELKTSVLSWLLSGIYHPWGRAGRWQPFVTAGVGLARNRLQEERGGDDTRVEAAMSLLATVGAGVRYGSFELAAIYRRDRFTTARFLDQTARADHDWDHVVLALRWSLTRSGQGEDGATGGRTGGRTRR